MSVFLSPVGGAGAQFFDNNGNPLTGGKLYTYAAGTTTPQATYTSAAGATFHTNPIILDAAGRVPGSSEIWLADNQIYKFVLKDSNDVLLATWDQITGVNSNFVNFTAETEVQTATAGQTVFTLTTISYVPGTGSLTVFVDGVNQYEGTSYLETDGTTVTFTAGLHVGALVKFTTAVQTTGNATDASVVVYSPPFTGGVLTTVEAKLAQIVSVEDFGATGNGVVDDAVGWRAAIAHLKSVGGGVLQAPASDYYFESYVTIATAIPAITWQNDPCVLLDGCENIVFDCGNATIHIDNSIASAHPNGSGATTFGFNNCVNVSGNLPIIEGNRTGLASNKFNNGIWLESCVNINFDVLKFTGDFDGGSCVAGGHIFDSTFQAIYAENTSFGVDVTCLENVVFDQICITNPAVAFVSGFNCFLDAVSYAYNVTGRSLVSGMSSNVTVNNISANDADTVIRLDGVDGANVNFTSFSGSVGVSISTTSATDAIGKITKNVKVSGVAQNLTGVAAVLLDTGTYGLDNIEIKSLNVSNCSNYAIDAVNFGNIGVVQIHDCNFVGQTQTISGTFADYIGKAKGSIVNNANYNPVYYIPRALPSGTGIGNLSVNDWPFPVNVIINTTGSEFVTHIVEPDGTDLDLGTVQAKGSLTVTLLTGEGLYFTGALPTQWQWRGM